MVLIYRCGKSCFISLQITLLKVFEVFKKNVAGLLQSPGDILRILIDLLSDGMITVK